MARSFHLLIGFVLLSVFGAEAKTVHSGSLRRYKREWIVPPQILEENVDYTKQIYIARIRSDKEDASKGPIKYSLKGIGADQEPYNLFVVDANTGNVRITGLLDRERISQYNLSGTALYPDGSVAENDIQLRIKVKDQNDNAPIFLPITTGSVKELSTIGTTVMKITAMDADEPGNINSQIHYEIVDQKPAGAMMFSINQNGEVIVNNPNLDRESIDQYVLTVKASDLNGGPGCNSGMATFNIQIEDVNDNPPILEKDSYEASIEENTENVEVMRFKTTDKDLQGTENWQADYQIVSGNGGGHFKIVTDPKTNEGVLMLVKAVDYEEVKDMNLGIVVNNVAPYDGAASSAMTGVVSGGGGGGGGAWGAGAGGATGMAGSGGLSKIYNMHVNVKNQPEGPRFIPKVKAIPISENGKGVDISKAITTYYATDSDTGLPAKGVKYVKGSDRDNWLSIDENTGAIKLNKIPDRESPYLVNGTYMAEILCISQDMPSKTATGTVAIQVEDFNDHCPTLKNKTQTMCTTQEVLYVSAEDIDDFPNGAPFKFNIIPEGTDGKWSLLEHFSDTTAVLKPEDTLWPGPRQVTLEIRDQQGISCPDKQVLKLDVCTCDKSATCDLNAKKSSKLGGAGIGLLLLGLLLLLLIPLLLLLCQCGAAGMTGAFADIPYDTKEHLISYHTEGQGEDRDVPLILNETDGIGIGRMKGGMGTMIRGAFGSSGYRLAGGGDMNMLGHTYNGMEMTSMDHGMSRHLGMMRDGFSTVDSGMALDEDYLNCYYSNRSQQLHVETEDNIVPFGFEGIGSPAGSVGCCSVILEDYDLDFLDDLGPKFTTLAEICGGTKFTAAAPNLPPPSKPVMDHTESVSMHTNFANIANTASNVASTANTRMEENTLIKNTQVVSDVQPVQTMMVQQQPMYYMVEPQVSNTVLLAERPAMGLTQGMYVLNSAPVTERVLVQGAMPAQATIGGGDRMVLLETHGGSNMTQNTGLLQSANLSGSQLLLVDAGAQGGHVLQGTLQRGGISGSQGIMLVEGQGALQRGGISGSQGIMVMEGQGALQRGGISGSQGIMVMEGQGTLQRGGISGSQGIMVMEGQGTLQRGGISGSQGIMVMEGQGTLQRGGISGSQGIMLVEGQGTLQRGGISGSQGIMLVEGQGGSTINGSLQRSVPVAGASQSMVHVVERQGGTSGFTQGSLQGGLQSTALSQNGTVHGLPSSRKVVIQEKKVVKTNL